MYNVYFYISVTFAVHIYVYVKVVVVAPLLYGVPFVPKILSVLHL